MTRKSTVKKSTVADKKKKETFPVVSIASSAGGLEAVSMLLKHLPADTGMAYIYVQHLSPDQKSLTTELLAKQTAMEVQEIRQMQLMKPDHVYVIPNDKGLEVTDGHIRLISRPKKSPPNLTADTLFISLAQTHKEEVIGVVLSGNGSDGTQGLRAIKSEGGITFAQNDTAKNLSMPHSAISAGVVDFILSPRAIALNLGRLGRHFRKHGSLHFPGGDNEALSAADLKKILSLIYKQNGVDFSLYKPATIRRRILRRVLLSNVKGIKKYITLLQQNKNEVEKLQADLLINFTCFFRDTETHEHLKKKVFPKLVRNRSARDPIRIWTVGCSTGEEAYSLAILMQEVLGREPSHGQIQIFATDLSATSIQKARAGIYSKDELNEVSEERIRKFFIETSRGFRITKSIRDMCTFAAHNVLSEPPFSRLELISCCNMLIYLDTEAQKKVMSVFHYALKDAGYLVLGKSETLGSSGHLFLQQHKKLKIYTAKMHSSKPPVSAGRTHRRSKQTAPVVETDASRSLPAITGELERNFDSILLDRYFPACVVINSSNDIVIFRGKTAAYLENPAGKASLNILRMAKSTIAFELRNLLSQAANTSEIAKSSVLEVKQGKQKQGLVMEVVPFEGPSKERHYLVLFSEEALPSTKDKEPLGKPGRNRLSIVEEQLSKLKSDMTRMMKDHDQSTEALQNANDEIISSNQELQSLNEELETSREEIESTNEELNATIQELLAQNQLLAESYRYSEDIIATLHEPVIVLDHELNVKTANTAFYKLFKLEKEEVEAHSIYQVDNGRWDIPKLRTLLESILKKNSNLDGLPVTLKLPKKGMIRLLLNARRIVQQGHKKSLILLAMTEDASRPKNLSGKKAPGKTVKFTNKNP